MQHVSRVEPRQEDTESFQASEKGLNGEVISHSPIIHNDK